VTDAETRRTTMNGEEEPVSDIDANGASPPVAEPDATQLATVTAERDRYLDQLQRSRAEFANFRRRTEQERTQIREIANHALLAQFLPILDDFQRALAAVPEDQRQTPLVQGLELIERKFWSVLERVGVSPIESIGQPFDPSLHEAVDTVPGTSATTVIDVYQPGYRLGHNLLRPAMVRVGDPDQQTAQSRSRKDGAAEASRLQDASR